jgi:hypothetical protein
MDSSNATVGPKKRPKSKKSVQAQRGQQQEEHAADPVNPAQGDTVEIFGANCWIARPDPGIGVESVLDCKT